MKQHFTLKWVSMRQTAGLMCASAPVPLLQTLQKKAKENPKLTVICEPDRDHLLAHLDSYVKPGDTILVKASQFYAV